MIIQQNFAEPQPVPPPSAGTDLVTEAFCPLCHRSTAPFDVRRSAVLDMASLLIALASDPPEADTRALLIATASDLKSAAEELVL